MPLDHIKKMLAAASSFHFKNTGTQAQSGWEGEAKGEVTSHWQNDDTLLFYEKGRFVNTNNKSFPCSNVYRWQFNLHSNSVRLEHLRFGADKPVFLFELIFKNDNTLQSANPHLCGADTYEALLYTHEQSIHLDWTIHKKNDLNSIKYRYNL